MDIKVNEAASQPADVYMFQRSSPMPKWTPSWPNGINAD